MVPLWGRCRKMPGAWLLSVVLLTACGPGTAAPSSSATPAVTMHSDLDARLNIGPIEPWGTTMPIYISLLSNHISVHLDATDSLRRNRVPIPGQPSNILGYHY